MQSEWFDIVILTIVVLSAIRGYISGLIMQLASLIGLVCCAFFAGQVAGIINPYINSSVYALRPLSYFLAFVIIMIAFFIIGKALESFLKALKINTLNRLSGAIFATVKWLFLASILLNLLVEFDQRQQLIKSNVRENSHSYPYVKAIAPAVIPFLQNSPLNPP
ncbi:CvpA family protein [Viscerimonas tarda]